MNENEEQEQGADKHYSNQQRSSNYSRKSKPTCLADALRVLKGSVGSRPPVRKDRMT